MEFPLLHCFRVAGGRPHASNLIWSCGVRLDKTRYFFNLHYAVNLQLRLRAKTKANPERGRAKSELGWAKSEQGRAKSEQGMASWKFHIEY